MEWLWIHYHATRHCRRLGLVTLRNSVEAAWSQIDVQLKRRRDLIPNLVEVTKDAMSYEQETLTAVVEARAAAVNAAGGARGDAMAAEGMLTAALGRLLAVVENYPELKANENVMQLTEELTSTENRISFARQHYNELVAAMNTKIEAFPSNLVAAQFNFERTIYFEIEEDEKEPIAVDLR